jgi:hypothetical protein
VWEIAFTAVIVIAALLAVIVRIIRALKIGRDSSIPGPGCGCGQCGCESASCSSGTNGCTTTPGTTLSGAPTSQHGDKLARVGVGNEQRYH